MRNILIPITIVVMLSLLAVGCGEDFESPEWLQWKWGKKETPTTTPTEELATDEPDESVEPDEVVTDDAAALEMFEAQLAAADPITVGPQPRQLPQPLGTQSDWPEEPVDEPTEPADEPDEAPMDPDEPPSPADVAAEIEARRSASEPVDDWTGPEIDGDLEMDLEDPPVIDESEESIDEPAEEDATSMGSDEADMSALLLEDISLDGRPAESAPVSADPGDLVAASLVQVNDQFITVNDVLRSLHPQFISMPPVTSEGDFQRQAASLIHGELQRQVVEALVLAEAEAAMTDRQETLIDQEMENMLRTMIAEAGGSRQVLEQQFRQRYTTLDEILAEDRTEHHHQPSDVAGLLPPASGRVLREVQDSDAIDRSAVRGVPAGKRRRADRSGVAVGASAVAGGGGSRSGRSPGRRRFRSGGSGAITGPQAERRRHLAAHDGRQLSRGRSAGQRLSLESG
jgi:hypothetical protein